MPRGKDTRDHEGRRPVDPRITYSQDTDEAPAGGIPRPNRDFVDKSATEDNSDIYTEGEKDTPEDAKEREDLKKDRGLW
jgi:hypothetical protein